MRLEVDVSEDVMRHFELALQLTGESRETVIEALMRAYILKSFSQTANAYQSAEENESVNSNYKKALHKMPKWIQKPLQIPCRIIRAYLQLAEEQEHVTYSDMAKRCNDIEGHPDEYVATFANNFSQMKIDSDKSHGKVFEVNENGIVTLWGEIKEAVIMNEKKIKGYSTAVGYVNKNNQTNMGRTELAGTGNLQWLYRMKCGECGHEYYANGHDIFLKKCPVCQGGANTGAK